ncbi:MAG: hypothetical protein ACRC6V_03195 [Bacteroidales bacterium]
MTQISTVVVRQESLNAHSKIGVAMCVDGTLHMWTYTVFNTRGRRAEVLAIAAACKILIENSSPDNLRYVVTESDYVLSTMAALTVNSKKDFKYPTGNYLPNASELRAIHAARTLYNVEVAGVEVGSEEFELLRNLENAMLSEDSVVIESSEFLDYFK